MFCAGAAFDPLGVAEPLTARERPFKLGPLGTLNQIIVALGKTIRAMADGTLDSQVGARICNGLGIMRACLETQKLEQLEEPHGRDCRPGCP
jgi:hypothetical protein